MKDHACAYCHGIFVPSMIPVIYGDTTEMEPEFTDHSGEFICCSRRCGSSIDERY